MGKRSRRRRDEPAAGGGSFADLGLDLDLEPPDAVAAEVPHQDAAGRVLVLRTAMSPGTRAEYAALLKGERSGAAAAREDLWHRAAEFLFERLATSWTVAGVATTGDRELLARYRAASPEERDGLRLALRAHLAEHLPDLRAP